MNVVQLTSNSMPVRICPESVIEETGWHDEGGEGPESW